MWPAAFSIALSGEKNTRIQSYALAILGYKGFYSPSFRVGVFSETGLPRVVERLRERANYYRLSCPPLLLRDAEDMGRGSKMLADRYQASTRGFVVEEYRNEYLDGLVGQVALVKQLTAPQVDEELLDKFEEDPLTGKVETLRSRTALRMVVGYDELGVVLRPVTEGPEGVSVFVPWSAVIELSPAVVSEE